MSHFTVLAIVDPEKDVMSQIEANMARYDENTSMDEYETSCWCINREAQGDARELAWLESGYADYAAVREQAHKDAEPIINVKIAAGEIPSHEEIERLVALCKSDNRDQETWESLLAARESHNVIEGECYRAITGPIAELETFLNSTHPLVDKPDPDCDECNGTGITTSTYNPDSKWDWWRIGGRWDGALLELTEIDDGQGGFNFSPIFETLKRNSDVVKNVAARDFKPFAILTPEGEWVERAKMGWWAVTWDEVGAETWEQRVKDIYAAYPDYLAVLLDCHI